MSFPELGDSAWRMVTIPAAGGDSLGIEYFMIPAWFAETFVIDRGGRISYKHIGAITSATLATKLDQVLAGETPVSEGRGEFRTVQ